MATFLSPYTCCSRLLLLQLLFLSSGDLIPRTNGALITDICQQTKEPPLCLSVLGSDPRSRSATLPQLAQIAIDMAEYNATATKIKIHALLMSAKDPTLKSLYGDCENLYLDALAALQVASEDLERRRYGGLSAEAARVREAADRCEAAFKRESPFKMENKALGIVAQAIEVITKNLSG